MPTRRTVFSSAAATTSTTASSPAKPTGASYATWPPSGESACHSRSGFPKSTFRGMSSPTPRTLSARPHPVASVDCAPMDSRPIGMFDSGVGGLTVLPECLVTLPHEDFVYFGDSHPDRFPYGPKPAAVIARFAHEVASHLAALDVKLIVVACNAATASALPDLQREFD